MKNIQNLSAGKSEREEIIAIGGHRWEDINWIFKTGGVMVFTIIQWDSIGF
jgi:hypothetical protein